MLRESVLSHTENPTRAHTTTGENQDVSEEQEIDVLEVMTLVLREKKTVLKFILVTAALAAVLVFVVMKPMYTAEAIFLPPQSAPGSGMSQLASQLGSLGAIGSFSGLKSPGDIYLGILGSRTIADDLIKRFELQRVYKIAKVSDTEKNSKREALLLPAKIR